ncbi:NnrS family protein [Ottowia thiooxydans]|uniref:NnrS family protein n=1 Tax=Ottowia thiooxydans TaxID=219182 RepID=UPI0006844198|nr:NnrS family protein [Ottowia thiooxydans]
MTEPSDQQRPQVKRTISLSSASPASASAPARPAKPAPVVGPWRLSRLMEAPHRLSFTLAMLVLVAASLWWLAVQIDRVTGLLGLSVAVPPTLTHGAVMVLGFMPLYFSGFLFTAGPNWLRVTPLPARQLSGPLGLQTAGWLIWLAGAHMAPGLALAGLALAAAGLTWMFALYWGLVRKSTVEDRVHAKAVGWGGAVGVLCLAGMVWAQATGMTDWALVLVRTALWGFIVVVFVAVAHRMIPFFTSSVLPLIEIWRPFWVLWLMLGVAAWEVLAVWVDFAAPSAHAWPAWTMLCIAVEAVAGAVLLWLAVVWGLVQSLKIRLLAMLHVGFVWFGLALLYSALSQALWLMTERPVLGLGSLHALSMGFLGSLMIAMVTRVSCGHSGRALVADDLVWALFWVLQAVVGVRLLAAIEGMPPEMTTLAALGWALVVTVWGLRYANWYGRPRTDGKPG